MSFLQTVDQGFCYLCSAALHIVCHLVKSTTIVVVLQLPERLHRLFHVVVDYCKAVAAVVKCLPTREIKVLGVVHQVIATLQHICSAQRSETVKVETNDKVGIVGY